LREKHGMSAKQAAVGVLDLRRSRVAMIHPDPIEYVASVTKIGILLAYFHVHRRRRWMRTSNEMAAKYSQAMGLREIQQVLHDYGF
jgi:ABC-type dipeptide/oligopeptide/nickel transport system ATPase component